MNPSKLKGIQRRAHYDNFLIECRANGSLANQDANGKVTPFCHGWIDVPLEVEIYVARKFNVQPFLWDRPPEAKDEPVRGILFDYFEGSCLYQIQLYPGIANDIRAALRELHYASIAHGDVRPSNILGNSSNNRVNFVDLSDSVAMPHIKITAQELNERQSNELRDLEAGFALLSEVTSPPRCLFTSVARETKY